jgi:hypothetical protein
MLDIYSSPPEKRNTQPCGLNARIGFISCVPEAMGSERFSGGAGSRSVAKLLRVLCAHMSKHFHLFALGSWS